MNLAPFFLKVARDFKKLQGILPPWTLIIVVERLQRRLKRSSSMKREAFWSDKK